ncbi:phytanoyl-CoA dioxygenase family protein [Pelagibacteraceae bacterium]|nr:phytanoyl-CoA dioxygenase family protein [Pelagibacteraceae bacterium]
MEEKNIFTKEFQDVNYQTISDEIKNNGFFSFENAMTEEFMDNITNDVKKTGLSLNTNNVGGVYYTHGNQFFLTHMLAVSKSFFNCCTGKKVLDICTDYFGEKFRLKTFRYYENIGGQNMQWHTDNRYYFGDTESGTNTSSPGLIFLAYMADVNDGEFQYVRGSHKWSLENKFNDYPPGYIEEKYPKDIVGFKKPRGTIVVYSTYGVHRAKPTTDKNFVRKSILFRVDKDIEFSEPILVRTEYLKTLDEKVKLYLGFGRQTGQETYPNTNLETLPINKRVFNEISRWLLGRLANKFPGFIRKRLRKALKA